jgi:3-phosphoshikimate 1-carboxyvinyltransferase
LVLVTNLKSIPYINMTLDVLKHFGIKIRHFNYERFEIKGNQKLRPKTIKIESDWSGAAFFLVAGAIAGPLSVTGLNLKSHQGDKRILNAMVDAGADLKLFHNLIYVETNPLYSFNFDATHCPDLFPPLAVLAVCCKGESRIKGISRLAFKESNRAITIQKEFGKLGIRIELVDDDMLITGGPILGGVVDSCADHRIAMAMGILSLVSESPITIHNPEVVNKSYPTFFEDLKKVGIPNI